MNYLKETALQIIWEAIEKGYTFLLGSHQLRLRGDGCMYYNRILVRPFMYNPLEYNPLTEEEIKGVPQKIKDSLEYESGKISELPLGDIFSLYHYYDEDQILEHSELKELYSKRHCFPIGTLHIENITTIEVKTTISDTMYRIKYNNMTEYNTSENVYSITVVVPKQYKLKCLTRDKDLK